MRISAKKKQQLLTKYNSLNSNKDKEKFIYNLYSTGYTYLNLNGIFKTTNVEFWVDYFKDLNVKYCSKCHQIKTRQSFTSNHTVDGLRTACHSCNLDIKKNKKNIRLTYNSLKSDDQRIDFLIKLLYNYKHFQIASTFGETVDYVRQWYFDIDKKFCVNCSQIKPYNDFNNDSTTGNGYASYCKECSIITNNEYFEENKDIILEKQKIYSQKLENKQRSSQLGKQHYIITKDNLAKYDTYYNQLNLYYKVIRDTENNDCLQTKCKQCNEWFSPTGYAVRRRITAINGNSSSIGTESHLYCSEECKQQCSLFSQRSHPRNSNPNYNLNRDPVVQRQWREMLIDESIKINGQIQCGACETIEGPFIAHHFEGIHYNPLESADIDGGILLCSTCNKRAHKQPGCRPVDMQCKTE